jgi:hypothetical protein
MRYAIKVGLAGGTYFHPPSFKRDIRRKLMDSNVSCPGVY